MQIFTDLVLHLVWRWCSLVHTFKAFAHLAYLAGAVRHESGTKQGPIAMSELFRKEPMH